MIERVSLFNSNREISYFLLTTFFILFLSLSFEYFNYKKFTTFDSVLVNTIVLKQYKKSKLTKTGKTKTYQVLKLKSDSGVVFYTTASKKLKDISLKKIELEAWAGEISFYEYMSGFFAFSKILHINETPTTKNDLNSYIAKQHIDKEISSVYQALFSAKQLQRELQIKFSNLGISHLIAISGFHLGVLSAILFFLFKIPYTFFQNRYFPYRSYKVDSFIIISIFLLIYLLFLDSPPSLLRAFVMLCIGFILYDRGIKIISMQTLFLTIILILAFFPRLFLNIGFWLSVSGVFYIFLFILHFKNLRKLWQFTLLPLWVYMLMLPYSLVIFGNFSIYHPLSILWTSLFSLFYPLSMLLHIFEYGDILDFSIELLLNVETQAIKISLSKIWLAVDIVLSLFSLVRKEFLYLLIIYNISLFIYAINYVT